jgi:hypothetical protein
MQNGYFYMANESGDTIMQTREICKDAVAHCMRAARFGNFRESAQVALFAQQAYAEAAYDKPDEEVFLKVWMTAYEKAQELLVVKSSPFSTSRMPSQKVEMMRFAEIHEGGFDAAYAWVAKEVEEAVGIPQEQESEKNHGDTISSYP